MKKFTLMIIFAVIANLVFDNLAFGQITQVTGSPQSATTTSTTLTITRPSGLAVGNVMLLQIVQTGNGAVNSITDVDLTGSGWTQIAGSYIQNAASTVARATLYYKIATAGDVAAANFSFTLDADSDDGEGGIIAFTGVDNTGGVTASGAAGGPFDVDPGDVYTGLSSDNNFTATAISTVSANSAIVMFGAIRDDNSITDNSWSTTNPGSLTELYDVAFNATVDMGMGAAWAIKSAIGSTNTGTADLSGTDPQGSILIALKSLPLPPANQPIGCNGQFFISHGTAGTSGSTTSMDKLTFSGGNITAGSFSSDPTGIGFNGIGINPLDGYMYGVRYSPMHLVKIGNGTPGNINDLGTITNANISSGDNAYAGCFDSNGDYYFTTDANEFYKITGINAPAAPLAATYIGTVSPATNYFLDIAIDPTDGQMYGVAGTGTSGKNLYKINKGTGALTLVGTYSGTDYIAALFFDEVGNLYSYRQDGTFQLINKTNATLTQVGTAASYTYADGCSCSFGRVFHDLDFTANPGNQICPTAGNPNPTFPLVVSVTNQTSGQQTGLIYTLNMVDPLKRFRFTESAATIKANLITAGLATAGSVVTLTAEAPATGTNYNKVVVTGFQTGAAAQTLSVTLQVQLYTLGSPYNSVPLQSEITGLLPQYGGNDLSNDPTSIAPDDPTVITFCQGITLPVRLLSFSGTYKNDVALLNWEADNQVNFAYYDLQRSSDAVSFNDIARKPSLNSGTSKQSYQYADDLSGVTGNYFYYRLKMVDIDGKFSYSNIVMIRKDQKNISGISVIPNPVTNNMATLQFSSSANAIVDIRIIDISGKVVLRQQSQIFNGVNSISVNNLGRLQSGIYTVQIVNGDITMTSKFSMVK